LQIRGPRFDSGRRLHSLETLHDTSQYASNRVERSYQPTRVRERGMRLEKRGDHLRLRVGKAIDDLVCPLDRVLKGTHNCFTIQPLELEIIPFRLFDGKRA